GAGKADRMDRVFKDCLILEVIVGGVIGIGCYVFGHELIGIFTTSPEVIESGFALLAYSTLPYFLCGIFDLFPGIMRGMGYSTPPMILSVIGTVGTRVVWIVFLFPVFRSLRFIFLSYPVSWVITMCMQIICYIIVRKRVHAKMNPQ
ncbi:MAG: MATE family efflux transporter, partial [Bacteroidaceae bacterium]|nr:MATE family efflux transporter [Bacteroidaceae bacterium]